MFIFFYIILTIILFFYHYFNKNLIYKIIKYSIFLNNISKYIQLNSIYFLYFINQKVKRTMDIKK